MYAIKIFDRMNDWSRDISFIGYYTGYYHVKMRIWAIVLFMTLGTPLSVLLYKAGGRLL